MAGRPLFANHCPHCLGPLTAGPNGEWACNVCHMTYEPCGNYLILREMSLLESDEETIDDLLRQSVVSVPHRDS